MFISTTTLTLSSCFVSLSSSALHALQWLCLQHSTFGGISISICSCLSHTASCIVSCIFVLHVLSLHLCVSVSPHFCISSYYCQTSPSRTSLLHCSHFVLLHRLCPLPTLIDVGISRCYQTSTAFPLHHHTHLGGFWCVGFWVFVVLPHPRVCLVLHRHLGWCQMHHWLCVVQRIQ